MDNLKSMTPSKRGEIFHSIRQELDVCIREVDKNYLKIGMLWAYLCEHRAWRWWGEPVKDANSLVRELNLGIKRGELDHLRRIWLMFGKYLQKEKTRPPLSKLILVHPVLLEGVFSSEAEKESAIAEWVNKANSLPLEAFKNEIRVSRGLVPTDVCTHEGDHENWLRCCICNKFYK